ncbi:MAG: hypothetical protein ACT4PP_00510 [Sporichthyaceae bacterium]
MKAKRNALAALGWVTWKIGARLGVPYAKKKLRGHEDRPAKVEVHKHPPAERG